MPKTKKAVTLTKKQKLSHEERSQIAKARWAKRRATLEVIQNAPPAPEMQNSTTPPPTPPSQPPYPQNPQPEQPPVSPESHTFDVASSPVPATQGTEAPQPYEAPVSQTRVPKQKRYTGPKEFSKALKTAESRLAKAIMERAQAAGKLAALQAEIPSLLGIINALKGSSTPVPPMAYDAPSFQVFSPPIQPVEASFIPQHPNPVAMAQSAQVAPPISRAKGGAVQFSPDVVGSLEGPEDDEDKFITGPDAGRSGWM